jgi:hypothetical protein
MGDRWALAITCRPMEHPDAMALVPKFVQGVSAKVLCGVPQPGLDIGSPGSPVVSSGSGTTLAVTGMTSGYGFNQRSPATTPPHRVVQKIKTPDKTCPKV